MPIEFKATRGESTFLDPRRDFQPGSASIEVRVDPLTGRTGRVGHSIDWRPPAEKPDLSALVRLSLETGCPFCPESVEKVTPCFSKEIAPEGRIRVGEALVVPNLFPYDQYNGVCIVSRQHYVELNGFSPEMIRDAFLACQEYLQRAQSQDARPLSVTVGWNYLPMSGGSIIHPHISPVAGPTPPNAVAELLSASRAYFDEHRRSYWDDLVTAEEQKQQRFLGHVGRTSWMTVFAPRGWLGDFLGVVPGRSSILDLTQDDYLDLARGIALVQRYWSDLNLASFNLVLNSAQPGDDWFSVHVRLVVRFSPRPSFGMSDYHWLNLLQQEGVAILPPELVATQARPYFQS